MGLFSSFKKSWEKSGKLRKLQKRIYSAQINFEGEEEKQLMNKYFEEICLQDEGVVSIINDYGLSKDDLYQYFISLSAAGLGQWIKGHYVPLSTIAYHEPLLYLVESEKRDVSRLTILENILDYWKGSINQGQLLTILKYKG